MTLSITHLVSTASNSLPAARAAHAWREQGPPDLTPGPLQRNRGNPGRKSVSNQFFRGTREGVLIWSSASRHARQHQRLLMLGRTLPNIGPEPFSVVSIREYSQSENDNVRHWHKNVA